MKEPIEKVFDDAYESIKLNKGAYRKSKEGCYVCPQKNKYLTKGKAIYKPKGKAGEYAQWACNFHTGCSNGCLYCYLKKGIGKAVLGGDKPMLKKCFKDDKNALEVFERELKANMPELQMNGLFFTFTSDPCLPDTFCLNITAAQMAICKGISVTFLTKNSDTILRWLHYSSLYCTEIEMARWRTFFSVGFTLTGHDDMELKSSSNVERIRAMAILHDAGFKTWASIEPIIDFHSSLRMIRETMGFCDLYAIGLLSGTKITPSFHHQLNCFIYDVCSMLRKHSSAKVFWKNSVSKVIGEDVVSEVSVSMDFLAEHEHKRNFMILSCDECRYGEYCGCKNIRVDIRHCFSDGTL